MGSDHRQASICGFERTGRAGSEKDVIEGAVVDWTWDSHVSAISDSSSTSGSRKLGVQRGVRGVRGGCGIAGIVGVKSRTEMVEVRVDQGPGQLQLNRRRHIPRCTHVLH